MRHAAGETSHRFHFLRLAQLDFQGATLGDIADDGDHAQLAGEFDAVGGHLNGAEFSRLYTDADFQIARFAGTFQKRDDLLTVLGIGPESQFHGGAADDFLAGKPGEAEKIVVHFDEAAIFHGSDGDHVRAQVKRLGEFFFGDAQFFFGVLAVGDVADGKAEGVLIRAGGRDAVHACQKPALAGRDIEGVFDFFTAAAGQNSVENLRKWPEEFFANDAGNALPFQFVARAIQKLLVGGPDIQESAFAIEFENDFINGADEGFQARFVFDGAAVYGRRLAGRGIFGEDGRVRRLRNDFPRDPTV